jgi:hypothetical protein
MPPLCTEIDEQVAERFCFSATCDAAEDVPSRSMAESQ